MKRNLPYSIGKNTKHFPQKLLSIDDCPEKLNFIGNLNPDLFKITLGVVGSRRMTSYGKRVVEDIVSVLSTFGVTIVSGFMYGVDSYAHEVCVENEGKTIAVLPYGILYPPPSYQQNLRDKILQNSGLIVSEFDNGFPPSNWTFPKRNRLVAGFSDAVLVIEAGEKSGSLITADLCIKYGRKLFCVPGPIDSSVSVGTNKLIKMGKGNVVTSANDILEFFGLKNLHAGDAQSCPKINFQDAEEKLIYEMLVDEPMTLDEISEKLEIEISTVGHKTMQMILSGALKEKEGRFYVG